jgi:ribosome biogenesis GTPase
MSWWSDDDADDPEFDESDVRVRPNPKGNRPRTKTRPEHAKAVHGMVLIVDRGRYTVLLDAGEESGGEKSGGETEDTNSDGVRVTATQARELGRKSIVTGDRVALVGDTSGAEGSLARIVRVEERSTLLRRSADDTDTVERVIVANADQMLIVVAAANPEPRIRLVDRYLVAAFDARLTPILCITKTDLADPSEFLAHFDGLDLIVVTSRSDAPPLDEIAKLLVGHVTVAVGHSGVGKSTLVNALVPDAHRAVGHVNEVTGRGRHTSSSSICLRFTAPEGIVAPGSGSRTGWIIDTPGVRSFGLGHVDTNHLIDAFGDLARIAEECPRGCTHLPDAPDCAMNEAVASGALDARGAVRLDSLQRLIATLKD